MSEPSAILPIKPGVIAAALPHLLGFHPRESLVCLWLSGSRLLVLQRADLPSPMPSGHPDIDDYLAAYLTASRNLECDEVVVVCVTEHADLAREIIAAMPDRVGVRIVGRFITDGSRLRDATGPGRWTWISTADRQRAAEICASRCPSIGRGPLRDRAQVLEEVDFDPRFEIQESNRAWGHETRTTMIEALRSGPPAFVGDSHLIAHIGSHVEGRDALIWCAARMEPPLRRNLLDGALSALRATPPGSAAHLASLCAAIAWMCGDGVRANAAVDRCLIEEPGHVLGRMIEVAISAAVPPSSFIAMVEQIQAQVVGLQEGCVDGADRGGYSRN